MLLLVPLAAALCFALGVLGAHLVRSTGLEDVTTAVTGPVGDRPRRAPAVTRVVDAAGSIGQRSLLQLVGPRRRQRLDARLDAAGRPEGLTESQFLRRAAGFTVLGVVVGAFFALAGQAFLGLVLALVFAGWMHLWLRAVVQRRRREVAAELPDFLDVLAVTVSAGLGFPRALERVVGDDDSALASEVRRTLNDMRYGLGRRRALEALRQRNAVPSISTFVTAVLQAEELGTPLAEVLQGIAAEVRRQSAQESRRRAARAGPKVSLVVTTTIVPGAMLLIFSAMVLANLPSLRGVFG